jgi:hypothetical protein
VTTHEQHCSKCRNVLDVLSKADLDRLIRSGMLPDQLEQLRRMMQLFKSYVCTSCGNTVFEASTSITDALKENKNDIVGLS